VAWRRAGLHRLHTAHLCSIKIYPAAAYKYQP
jgi:hypothetical protein